MKKLCIILLCAIVLFTIIEAKPYSGARMGHGGGNDGGQGGGGEYGGQGGGGGGNGGDGGSQGGGGGQGGRGGGGHRRDDYYDYDYSYIYKPCRGRGCKTNYIGNGRQNTNTVYMYD